MKRTLSRNSLDLISAAFLAGLICHGATAIAAPQCQAIFSDQELKTSVDKSLQALAELRLRLDLANAEGIRSVELTMLTADYQNKEKELSLYLKRQSIMDHSQVVEAIKARIENIQNKKSDERAEDPHRLGYSKLMTFLIDGRRAKFHAVPAGKVILKRAEEKIAFIEKPFEMMATPVTQTVWRQIAELANPSIPFKTKIDPAPSKFKGDLLPIEQVSFNDTQRWIKNLNSLSKNGDPRLDTIIDGHQPGDTYRLPTQAEWTFVARGLGKSRRTIYFPPEAKSLDDFAWFAENSRGITQPVATKKPIIINNQDFYDIQGNVRQWVGDNFFSDSDHIRTRDDNYYLSLGFSFKSLERHLEDIHAFPTYSHLKSEGTGFRLVREIRDPK